MGSAVLEVPQAVQGLCKVCTDLPPRRECFLSIDGAEQPVCRFCWEQAVLDPRRVARRLHDPSTRSRWRVG